VIKEIGLSMWVMVFSMLATLFLVIFLKSVAKREKSHVLEADSLHYQVDLLTNGGVLLALIIIKYTGYHFIDSIVSVVIALYIIYSALELNVSVTKELLDTRIPEEEMDTINSILASHSKEIVEVHKLRTRKAGIKRFVDMHLVLYHGMSLKEGNDVRKDIESRIKSGVENADVNIYIEPCKSDQCERCGICEDNDGTD
jgi:cation diffusion facilitator family transporter